MKRILFFILFILSSGLLLSQPRPKDVIEHGPILYPEGKWRWLGANARLGMPNGTSLPGSDLSEGDFYYDTVKDSMYFYTGSAWKAIEDRTKITLLLDSLAAHNVKLSDLRATALTTAWRDSLYNTPDSLRRHNEKISDLKSADLTTAWKDTLYNTPDSLRRHNEAISALKSADLTAAWKDSLYNTPDSLRDHNEKISDLRAADLTAAWKDSLYNTPDSLRRHNEKLSSLTSNDLTTAWKDSLYNTPDSLRRHNEKLSALRSTSLGQTPYDSLKNQDQSLKTTSSVRHRYLAAGSGGEWISSIDTMKTPGGVVRWLKITTVGGDVFWSMKDTTRSTKSYGDNLTTDATYNGMTFVGTAGETMIAGHGCYLKSDGKMWRADADSAATMPCMFIATAATAAEAKGVFLAANGRIRYNAWDWSTGAILFMSTTKGLFSSSVPDGTGDQVQAVGIAVSADEIFFTPYPILVEK